MDWGCSHEIHVGSVPDPDSDWIRIYLGLSGFGYWIQEGKNYSGIKEKITDFMKVLDISLRGLETGGFSCSLKTLHSPWRPSIKRFHYIFFLTVHVVFF